MCIPKYFLYGEPIQDVDKRFLHVEPIAKRSRLHDWHIQPHSHPDLHHLLLVTRGGGVLRAEARNRQFLETALVRVPLGCVHGFEFQPESDGWIATLSADLLGLITTDYPELLPLFAEPGVVHLESDSRSEQLQQSFRMLSTELGRDTMGRRAALASGLLTLMVDALRLFSDDQTGESPSCSRDSLLVARLRELIDARYGADIGISAYARQLCVSQERLRTACVRVTGAPPVAMLAARRLLEAKRGLLYTGLTLAQIAAHCGFDDPAYFSRFFTQRVGEPPTAFRLRSRAIQPEAAASARSHHLA